MRRPAGAAGALLLLLGAACPAADPPAAIAATAGQGAVAALPPRLVRNDDELRAALAGLAAGVEVVIAPGEYRGGILLAEASGSAAAPIMIRGAEPDRPPVFTGGGSEGWHLSDCNHLVLRDLIVRGYAGNGVNVDDAGSIETPALGIVIERLSIEDTGPEGNHDALKLSGLDGFTIRGCRFRGWGGSAVDMVGCHDGLIEGCRFEGAEGFSQSSGIQAKGGSARVTVRRCEFENAGSRAVNLGGSTGLQYFRPPGAGYEAAELLVEGNVFRGSQAPIAFVGAVGCIVRDNDIHNPEKWLLRILQESTGPQFAPCQGGVFESNRIRFDQRVQVFVNVGPGTLPDSFVYRDNVWIETDAAGRELASPRTPF